MIAKIKELELENKKLKMGSPYGGQQQTQAEDKNWLSSGFGANPNASGSNFYKSGGTNRPGQAGVGSGFGGAMPTMDRPMTAAGGNQKVRDLENQLRDEQRTRKRLTDEIENLKKDLHKASFS